ncbi:hypothetical protein HKBW3S09_01542, partial [Candidatus Hakubella thermalkaliphila]
MIRNLSPSSIVGMTMIFLALIAATFGATYG